LERNVEQYAQNTSKLIAKRSPVTFAIDPVYHVSSIEGTTNAQGINAAAAAAIPGGYFLGLSQIEMS
jgi:hypothetical protein